MAWKIETATKKAIVVTETFFKTDGDQTYRMNIETTWRWGHVIVSDDVHDLDLVNEDGLEVSGFDIEDQEYDDGCALWFTFSDNVPEEIRELAESAWDEEGFYGLEELGWSHDDTETWFWGPLTIEDLGGDEEPEEPKEQPKGTWPF